MNLWTEFKQTLLPWFIAAAVIALLVYETHRGERLLAEQYRDMAAGVQAQAEALEGIKTLLAQQGYIVTPPIGTR